MRVPDLQVMTLSGIDLVVAFFQCMTMSAAGMEHGSDDIREKEDEDGVSVDGSEVSVVSVASRPPSRAETVTSPSRAETVTLPLPSSDVRASE